MRLHVTASLARAARAAAAAAAASVYVRGNDGDPETLDQHKASTVAEAHLLRDLCVALVIHGTAARFVPGVAEIWGISEEGVRRRCSTGRRRRLR